MYFYPGRKKMKKDLVCPNCGYRGPGRRITKGYFAVEVMLWLLLLVPGMIYSVWRQASIYQGCPRCGAGNLVPSDSPRGVKLIDEFYV